MRFNLISLTISFIHHKSIFKFICSILHLIKFHGDYIPYMEFSRFKTMKRINKSKNCEEKADDFQTSIELSNENQKIFLIHGISDTLEVLSSLIKEESS